MPSRGRAAGTGGESPRSRQARLVRHIAADPVLCDWLAGHDARVLEHAARQLDTAGHHLAAAVVRQVGDGYRSGKTSPFPG